MAAPQTAVWVLRTPEGIPIRCPKCQDQMVRYSDLLRFRDMLMRLIRRDALRCRGCRNRFYARTGEK